MTKVIIGIPTYNGYERVDWLLTSIWLRSSNGDRDILQDSKIVICDDSGRIEHQNLTRNIVCKWRGNGLPIELIVNERNLGVASSWNILAKSSNSEQIVIINDDIIVSGGWLESTVYLLDNNPKAGSCSQFCYFIIREDVPVLLSRNDAIIVPRDPFKKTPTEVYNDMLEYPGRVMAPAGCFFGMRRDIFEKVGGFDGNYRCFYEESDFGTALANNGYPTYALSWPKNFHIWSQTFANAPEINASKVMKQSRKYYINKWNGHFEITHPKYMSKIPFMKVRFRYKDQEYDKIIDGKEGIDGYYANEEDRKTVNTLIRIK